MQDPKEVIRERDELQGVVAKLIDAGKYDEVVEPLVKLSGYMMDGDGTEERAFDALLKKSPAHFVTVIEKCHVGVQECGKIDFLEHAKRVGNIGQDLIDRVNSLEGIDLDLIAEKFGCE